MRVLGVDPGLTRCGIGVIEAGDYRRLSFVAVEVLESRPSQSQDLRLQSLWHQLKKVITTYVPDVVSIEQVFARERNLNTVLGTAQVAGLAMVAAAEYSIPVAMHTPTEVKMAVTGNGMAKKDQVQRMVKRLLNLNVLPQPADAADALAQAICHSLRPSGELQGGEREEHLTPAQRRWAIEIQKSRGFTSHMRGRGM